MEIHRTCVVFDEDQGFAGAVELANRMAPFLFRCPITGFNVQGWTAEAVENDDTEKYEAVPCLVCQQLHLVNPRPGKRSVRMTNRRLPWFSLSAIRLRMPDHCARPASFLPGKKGKSEFDRRTQCRGIPSSLALALLFRDCSPRLGK
jgi:hypothetical protein